MTDQHKTKQQGRIAGILYLVIIACGIFSEGIVRTGVIVPGDAASTAANIKGSELLFRLGFASDLIMVLADIGIALVFYLMMKQVSKPVSMLSAVFRFAQAIIIAMNLMNHFGVIMVMNNTGLIQAFDTEQINNTILFLLEAHTYGYLLSGVFFGVSCLALGYLIYRSGFIPALFGIMLSIAGGFYLIDSVTHFVLPAFADITEVMVIAGAVIAEMSLAIWLVVFGARNKKTVS